MNGSGYEFQLTCSTGSRFMVFCLGSQNARADAVYQIATADVNRIHQEP